MTRIGSQLSSIELMLLNSLKRAQAGSSLASLRIAEEKYVLGPRYDPSAFVTLSMMNSDLSSVQAYAKNATAANSMLTSITQTDGIFDQITDQLTTIQAILESNPVTPAEKAAAQLQIDAAISTIDDLAGEKINGKSVFDGSADFNISGADSSEVTGFRAYTKVNVGQTQPEKAAEFTYTGTDRFVTDDATVAIDGPGQAFTVIATQGETLESLAARINVQSMTNSGGVVASVDNNQLTISSSNGGDDQSLSVTSYNGTFDVTSSASGTTYENDYAQLTYTGKLDASGIAVTTAAAEFTVTGNDGTSAAITVAADATLTSVAGLINAETGVTGIVATVEGTELLIHSEAAGSDQDVALTLSTGTFGVVASGVGSTSSTTRAEMAFAGGPLGVNTDFTLTGNDGTFDFSLLAGDTLEDAATAISAEVATTGINATYDANANAGAGGLTLWSVGTGANEQVEIDVTVGDFFGMAAVSSATAYGTTITGDSGERTSETSGQNSVLSGGTVAAVSGTIHESGTQAALVYTGTGGAVTGGDEGQWTITGSDGSATLTITAGMTLTDLATAVNNVSDQTGVVADYNAATALNTLTLESVNLGSGQTVVASTDSAVQFTGGQGNNTAFGTDAVATINGRLYTPDQAAEVRHRELDPMSIASGAELVVTGVLGSASVTLTAGDSLQEAADLVNAETGNTGIYAQVDGNDLVIKSQTVGAAGSLQIDIESGSFDLIDGYTTDATAAEVTFTGVGGQTPPVVDVDFSVQIAGSAGPSAFQAYNFGPDTTLATVAATVSADVATTGVLAKIDPNDSNNLIIYSADKGSDVELTVTNLGNFPVTGSPANGTDGTVSTSGSDGASPIGWYEGNTFDINQSGFHYQVEFAEGFTGDFSPITVSGDALSFTVMPNQTKAITLPIQSMHSAKLGGTAGSLLDLFSGGQFSGLGDNTSTALRIVSDALNDVSLAKSQAEGVKKSSIDTAVSYLAAQEETLEEAILATDGYSEQRETARLNYFNQLMENSITSLEIVMLQKSSIMDLLRSSKDLYYM